MNAPGRNTVRRSALRLTLRGWGFLAAAAVLITAAYTRGNQQLLVIGCLCAALLLSAALLVRLRRFTLSAERSVSPAVVPAGTWARVSLRISNRGSRATAEARWSDRLPWAPHESSPARLPSLARPRSNYPRNSNPRASRPRSATVVSYDVRPPRRGVVTIGPLLVELADPFGLVVARSSLVGGEKLIVAPRVYPLHDGALSSAAGDGSAVSIHRSTTGNEDDLMTREYRRGDALRRVHWRASARHGELMVRQEEQRSLPVARVVFDTSAAGYPDAVTAGRVAGRAAAATSESFEWVVSMVASLGLHLQESGYSLHLVETGRAQLPDARSLGTPLGLLGGLASIGLVASGVTTTEPAEKGSGPLFAVVSTPGAETLQWLLRQRRPYDRATVVVVGGDPETVEAFSGWQVITAMPDRDDPASVWAAALAEGEAR